MKKKSSTPQERAVGAVMGILIGDALGAGVHWYYNLEELRRDYGSWVTGYTDPKPGRYHHPQLSAGDLTQSGELSSLLLHSLADEKNHEYDHADFCKRFDDLLSKCNGTRKGGVHGWTNKDVCDVYRRRVKQKLPWGPATASPTCDTTDSICRAAILAARYYNDLPTLCKLVIKNAELQYADKGVIGQSICFAVIIANLIRGEPFDASLSGKLYTMAQEGELPFSFLRGDRDEEEGLYEPDGLLLFGNIFNAANDPTIGGLIHDKDIYKGVQLYGQACAWFMSLHSSYFIAARCSNDFEKGVLHSVNAGGQNVARTSMVGALLGAHLGANAIPLRFIEKLKNGKLFQEEAQKIAIIGANQE